MELHYSTLSQLIYSPHAPVWHIFILYGGIIDKIAIYFRYTTWCFDIGMHCKRIPIIKLYNTFIHHLTVILFSCVWEVLLTYTIEYYQLQIRPSGLIHLRAESLYAFTSFSRCPHPPTPPAAATPLFWELSFGCLLLTGVKRTLPHIPIQPFV